MAGRTRCKHICGRARGFADAGAYAESNQGHAHRGFPKARCPGCKKSNFYESTRYDALRGKVPVYTCDEPGCKRRFTWRPGFKKRWYGDDTITDALVDAGAGHPPSRIAERMARAATGRTSAPSGAG